MKTFEEFINKKEIDFKFGNVYYNDTDKSLFIYLGKKSKFKITTIEIFGTKFSVEYYLISDTLKLADLNLTLNEFLLKHIDVAVALTKWIDEIYSYASEHIGKFIIEIYKMIKSDKKLMNEINQYLDLNQIGLL